MSVLFPIAFTYHTEKDRLKIVRLVQLALHDILQLDLPCLPFCWQKEFLHGHDPTGIWHLLHAHVGGVVVLVEDGEFYGTFQCEGSSQINEESTLKSNVEEGLTRCESSVPHGQHRERSTATLLEGVAGRPEVATVVSD